jgi:hypothetical protein
MSITVNVDEALVRAAQKATQIEDPELLVKAGLSLLATSSTDGRPDAEIYTDERLAEFAQEKQNWTKCFGAKDSAESCASSSMQTFSFRQPPHPFFPRLIGKSWVKFLS